MRSNSNHLESMISRVAAVQKREHPIWDPIASFENRIAELPLYSLCFNNPDRPQGSGPTVAHYPLFGWEDDGIASNLRLLSKNPHVLDVGCGNGFIGTLLAREGLQVVGIDDGSWARPQIYPLHDPNLYELRDLFPIEQWTGPCDIAFCSWMSPGVNLTSIIARLEPTCIVLVFSPELDSRGALLTGTARAFDPPDGYTCWGGWIVEIPARYFSSYYDRLETRALPLRVVGFLVKSTRKGPEFIQPELTKARYTWDLETLELNALHRATTGDSGITLRPVANA